MARLLSIGDIHGCFTALTTLAALVPFRDDDLIVTLGDYVDRGPNSRSVIDWLIDRHAMGRLIALRGNHEVMMLDARGDAASLEFWLSVGGAECLASYHPGVGTRLSHVPEAHWHFLENVTRPIYETDTHFFVHACADSDVPLDEQFDDALYWRKFSNPPPHFSGKTMICGHTSQRSGKPLNIGHAVCIDTRVYGGGWLTCLNPVTGDVWQADEYGQTRSSRLD